MIQVVMISVIVNEAMEVGYLSALTGAASCLFYKKLSYQIFVLTPWAL